MFVNCALVLYSSWHVDRPVLHDSNTHSYEVLVYDGSHSMRKSHSSEIGFMLQNSGPESAVTRRAICGAQAAETDGSSVTGSTLRPHDFSWTRRDAISGHSPPVSKTC